MTYRSTSLAAAALLATIAGCASYPTPTEHMADAEGAARSAQDTSTANPQSKLHLKMAQEEIQQAKQLVADGDNERADSVLLRAKADAELALAEARETQSENGARQALAQIGQLDSTVNAPSSTTTTTSAVVSTHPAEPVPSTTQSTSTTTTTTTGGKP